MSDDEKQEDKFIQICNRLVHSKSAMNGKISIMDIINKALRLMDKSHFTKQFQNDYSKVINKRTTELPYQFHNYTKNMIKINDLLNIYD